MLRRDNLCKRSIVMPFLVLGASIAAPPSASGQLPGGGDSVAVVAPPVPNPAQQRYLQGLRTAGRGVAQIKTGVDRLNRARGGRDSTQVKVAAKRLTGYCSAARGFIASGRGQMDPVAYDPPTRKPARVLMVQLDSLSLSLGADRNESLVKVEREKARRQSGGEPVLVRKRTPAIMRVPPPFSCFPGKPVNGFVPAAVSTAASELRFLTPDFCTL